ncbi:MAG: hypothetical protein KatS3mg104_1582 [Phycisphaerae bacterium]|nr:MAG: hypothetical protein KatS3mg104_1582 [Phycisphaerae bacterium]
MRFTQRRAFVRSGQFQNVLIIGAETLSRVTDYTDRASCIIFGDGAGAVVVSRSKEPNTGLLYGQIHSDGGPLSEAMLLKPGSRHPSPRSFLPVVINT